MIPETIDRDAFRSALGRFATGVTVVTTIHEDGSPHGMTANAFVSVSLDPPLVLVSLDRNARMHDLLGVSDRYGISVLAEHQEPVSSHFARRAGGAVEPRFSWKDGLPFVDGALAQLGCRVVDRHPAGDHTLYIGRVEHLRHDSGRPLLFYTGRYGRLTPDEGHDR